MESMGRSGQDGLCIFGKPYILGRTVDVSWFSVIRCARFFKQLQVLEAVYIRTRDPVLCKQKENVVSLTLFK